MPDDVLYHGDNLDLLRRYIKDETIDLIYLDPPSKSNPYCNVLFGGKRPSGTKPLDISQGLSLDYARR